MPLHESAYRKTYLVVNHTVLVLLSLLCIAPLIHILAVSFSSSTAATAGEIGLWPVQFTWRSYDYVWQRHQFWRSLLNSFERITVGGGVQMLLTILLAYPLSKESGHFRPRTLYAWFFVITMLFHGGLIPWYVVIRSTGLLDTIWALVLPGAVPVFSVVLLLNFFRQLPREMEESAYVDGAGHWTVLWKIFVPTSLSALATIALFSLVGHWNSWFDGLILMGKPEHYPLQSYLQTVIVASGSSMPTADWASMAEISDRTVKSAQIFIGMLPILLVYPLLQKYFVKGIVLGSVKE